MAASGDYDGGNGGGGGDGTTATETAERPQPPPTNHSDFRRVNQRCTQTNAFGKPQSTPPLAHLITHSLLYSHHFLPK